MKYKMSADKLEELRASFLPSRQGVNIHVMLIAESPRGGRFFYDENAPSAPLSTNSMKAFEDFYKKEYEGKGDFLSEFQIKGFYLYDLLWGWDKRIEDAGDAELEKAKNRLFKFIKEYETDELLSVIVVVKRVGDPARKTAIKAGVLDRYSELDFPSDVDNRGQRFRDKITQLLEKIDCHFERA